MGNFTEATTKYNLAISFFSRLHTFIHEAAIPCVLAGIFHRELGNEEKCIPKGRLFRCHSSFHRKKSFCAHLYILISKKFRLDHCSLSRELAAVLFPFKSSQVGPLAHWSPYVQKKILLPLLFSCDSLVVLYLLTCALVCRQRSGSILPLAIGTGFSGIRIPYTVVDWGTMLRDTENKKHPPN